jgi:D-alanyl-D-alanine carboxypeptidase
MGGVVAMTQATISSSAIRLGRGLLVAMLLLGGVALPAVATGQVDARSGHAAAAPCNRACLAKDLRGDLRTYLKANGSAEHISAAGLSVRLPRSRGTIDVGAGTMRIGGTRPVSSTRVWQIGSNTKAFTSVMLLQLEAEHRLSISDTLGKWLPGYRQWRGVTIKRLLNMTSGIPSYDDSRAFLRDFAAKPLHRFTVRQLVAYAKSGKPTRGYSYSNTNYILGEMIIRRVTHDSYRHQLRTRLIRPLHLHDLHYRPSRYPPAVTKREPAGYFFNRELPGMSRLLGRDVSRTTLSWTRGAGGIISTTHDLAVWEQALYHGRLLPSHQQAELRSLVSSKTGRPIKHTTPSDPKGFGLGIAQMTHPEIGRFWFYEGETLAFRTLHVYLPGSRVIFAAALNSQPTVDHIGDLAVSVYGTLVARGVIRPTAPPGRRTGVGQ